MRIERRHASRGSAIYLPRLSMLMFPNWGQTARVTRIQLTTPPSNSSVKLSSPLLNLCLPSTARAYRFSRVGVFPHSLAFSLSPLPILLLLFFDRKKLDLSVNKNRTDICFAYFRRGVIEFENSETSASNREDTRHPPRHDIRDSRRWTRSRIHVPPFAFASKLLHSRIARVANFRNSERLLINYVSFFFFFTFRDCEMKLYSPTVNKFFLLRRWKSCTSGGISLYIFVVKK